MGGFRKIALNFGWFWIRYQFSIIMDLMFGAAGLNVVTKGKIFLFAFGFGLSAALLVSKSTQPTQLWSYFPGSPCL